MNSSDERNMGRVVLHDRDGLLISADVNLLQMAKPDMDTNTAALILDTLHAKVVLTGLGIRWVQTHGGHERLRGVHFKPVYLQCTLDTPLRLTLADYMSAQADFVKYDPHHEEKTPLDFVLRIVTPHGPVLVDPGVQLHLLGSLQVFRLQSVSPALLEA